MGGKPPDTELTDTTPDTEPMDIPPDTELADTPTDIPDTAPTVTPTLEDRPPVELTTPTTPATETVTDTATDIVDTVGPPYTGLPATRPATVMVVVIIKYKSQGRGSWIN